MGVIYQAKEFIPMTNKNDRAKYMVVKDERIVYIGDKVPEEFRNYRLEKFIGKTVVPGFFDTHAHFSSYGYFLESIKIFTQAKTINEIFLNLTDYISKNPKKFYILFGLSPFSIKENRLPTKKELDKINSKIPIFIVQYDGHAAIGNSALVKKIKMKKTEPGYYPEKGQFFMDSYYKAVKQVTNKASILDSYNGLKNGAQYAAEQGITSMVALQGEGFPLDFDVKMVKFYKKRSIINIIPYFQTRSSKKIKKSKLKNWGGCFECAIDGSLTSYDAALKDPYLIDTGIEGNSGKIFYEPKEIIRMLKFANKNKIQLAIHAIGDLGIEEVVNAYEKELTIDNPYNHRIEHALILNKRELEKIAKLKIHVATQPSFLHSSLEPFDLLEKILGKERIKRFIPLRDMVDAGIEISGGSDAPVTLPSPLSGIYSAMNHPNHKQSVTAYEALEMFTVNGAKGTNTDKDLGTLEVGKIADFVVLMKNPLEVKSEDVKNIKIKAVYRKGKQII